MTYYLTHARGRNNARHWLEYVTAMEPEALDRIRIGLALAPTGHEEEYSVRELTLLRRRVRLAMATAKRRWNLPLREIEEGVHFVDLPEEASGTDSTSERPMSAREKASVLWGTTPRVIDRTTPESWVPRVDETP